MVFYNIGTQKINEGPLGVNAGKDYFTGNWYFENDETFLNCTMLFGADGNADQKLSAEIVELTNSKLVVFGQTPTLISGSIPGYIFTQWTLQPAK
jgi:hypothetical protein